MLARGVATGLLASLSSALAAAAFGRANRRHGARPINSIAHIYDGGRPPSRDGVRSRNTIVGMAMHTAASVWWALIFEAFFGAAARRNGAAALAAGAGTSALACLVDYRVVSSRLRPGYERHLTRIQMFFVYTALAAGFILSARLQGRLHHHEVEDHHERHEGRHAQCRPYGVVAPE